MYKEITLPGYIEGSFGVKPRGLDYLMWSEGGWTGPDYRVAHATGKSPVGPFKPRGVILQADERVARGAGQQSVVRGRGRTNGGSPITAVPWAIRRAITGCSRWTGWCSSGTD